jgi:hypothetical protein
VTPEAVFDSFAPSPAQIIDLEIPTPTTGYVVPEVVLDSSAPSTSMEQITGLGMGLGIQSSTAGDLVPEVVLVSSTPSPSTAHNPITDQPVVSFRELMPFCIAIERLGKTDATNRPHQS